jgi:hypothetical protein
MLTSAWSNKVEVCMQSGLHRTFKGPQEAADFLEYEWPFRHAVSHAQNEAFIVGIGKADLLRHGPVGAFTESAGRQAVVENSLIPGQGFR